MLSSLCLCLISRVDSVSPFLIIPQEHPEVVSVFPNKALKLHTTRSWDFLGLEHNSYVPSSSIWRKARFGEDTIIANLDTGSFSHRFRFLILLCFNISLVLVNLCNFEFESLEIGFWEHTYPLLKPYIFSNLHYKKYISSFF